VKHFRTIHKQSPPLVWNLGEKPTEDMYKFPQQRNARSERHQDILLSSITIASIIKTFESLLGLDVDVGATAALVTFGSNDLVVVLSKVKAELGPGVEVVLHVDTAADALALANRPVLLEGTGTVD
jgi:hypothetical protein